MGTTQLKPSEPKAPECQLDVYSKPLACKCGADAILIKGMETENMTFMTWGFFILR